MRSGLYDSNGRELRAGDVYMTYNTPDVLYEVKFINGAFCGGVKGSVHSFQFSPLGWDVDDSDTLPRDVKCDWLTVVSPNQRNLRVYLSGSMTNCVEYKKDFMEWEEKLKNKYYDVVNPVREQERLHYEDYLHHDIELLLNCDFIFFVNDISTSKGAFIEKMVAEACGISTLCVMEEQ